MTDRINTITVVLEKEIREDDCESILNAIRMIKGVLSVSANVADPSDYLAIRRARHELMKKIYEVFE